MEPRTMTPTIGHLPATTLARARVTRAPRRPTVFCVAARWPYEDFAEYLRAHMAEAGIPDYAEMSRLSGINQTQLSNWRRGISRPSRESLAKVARALAARLNVEPRTVLANLIIVAGLADDADEDAEPARPAALPAELVDLLELWRDEQLSQAQRRALLTAVALAVGGVRAQLGRPERGRPIGRRRIS